MKVIGIIATKNRFDLLIKAVQSALGQTTSLEKLIIVSDSTDNNFEKEKAFLQGVDCTLLRDKYTHNYAGNLNTAIDFLLPKIKDFDNTYIAFLDDDDTWDSDYIKESIQACGDCDFVISGLRCNCDNHIYNLDLPNTLEINDFLRGNPGIQGSNTFIRLKTLLQAGCFDEELDSTTDRDLFTRVMKLNPTYASTRKYLVYIDSSNSRSRITNTGYIKKDGLSRFYFKHSPIMNEIDKEMFFERANIRFGLNKEDLIERNNEIKLNEEKDVETINKFNFLHPEIFSCIKDFKYFLEQYFNHKVLSKEYSNFVKYCLNYFYKGKETKTHEIALLVMEPDVLNNSITRVKLYEKYLKIINYIHVKNIRKKFMCDEEEILNVDNDEAEIKATFDYIRHIHSANNTFEEFKRNESTIKKILEIEDIHILGYGSEGMVFDSNGFIYKWFKNNSDSLINHLAFVKSRIKNCENIYDFEIVKKDKHLLIKYPYVKADCLETLDLKSIFNLIENFKNCGLSLTNIKKRNFVIDSSGIKYIDYGFSIEDFNQKDYERSKLRAQQLIDNFNESTLYFYKVINESYLQGEIK